jgi:hypothetical protein
VDFAFICNGGATEQALVAIEKINGCSPPRERKRYAAALKAASQHRNMHF